MDRRYIDRLESAGIPAPTTPMEVIAMMVEQLQGLASDLEYMATDEFIRLSCDEQAEAWFDARKRIMQGQQDHKELMSLMVKMFDRFYFNAVDLIDRLKHSIEETA